VPISRTRFLAETGWREEELAGKRVLDVGCGAGRFAEIVLSFGAELVAVDYSLAVDACWENLGPRSTLDVVQGDIFHLPFRRGSFDFVYCLGVLQHTPDVRRAFLALPGQLKKGGRLTVDVYRKVLLNILWPKYWLRALSKHMPKETLFRCVQLMIRYLLPISLAIGRVPRVGRKLRYAIPVVNHEGVFPLSRVQIEEWALLDTFDMLAALHDHPQTADTLRVWFGEAGLQGIEVFQRGCFVGRGVRP